MGVIPFFDDHNSMNKQQDHLKILMTTDTLGPLWQYCLELASALPENTEIHLASMGDLPDERKMAEAEAISNLYIYPSSYKLEWQDDPWDEVEQASMWLLHLEQKLQPDLVHLNHCVFGELPWDRPALVVGHYCMLSRWEATDNQPFPDVQERYRERIRKGLQSVDYVVAPSATLLRRLEAHYGPLHETEIIHYGITDVYQESRSKSNQILLSTEGIHEYEGLHALVKGAADLPYPLIIMGEHQADMHEASVAFTGKLNSNQLNEYLSDSRIFVSASRYEVFGWTALQAASQGCILILSDIDVYHEIWQDSALYFDPVHPESLREVILSLLAQPELTASLGKKSVQRSRDFDLKKKAKGYYELYHKLIHTAKQEASNTNSNYV